jgi:hypothetical protein
MALSTSERRVIVVIEISPWGHQLRFRALVGDILTGIPNRKSRLAAKSLRHHCTKIAWYALFPERVLAPHRAPADDRGLLRLGQFCLDHAPSLF